ncbi:MAG: class I SAM-dependent methyltransferase [Dissulfurimicrobium sp.]|uniref:class I SAM-dependent methyltransferase n=1 Tax=Dissulfurimicrobium sp. TaxID=2022436 RepID=UPI00404A917E
MKLQQPIDIPPHVNTIYRRLASKYAIEFESLTVKGRQFRFLCLSDIEPLIKGKDIFANISDFPFWVKIWESSIVLADFMARMPADPGQRILELGAGLGVVGIAAAGFGHRVTITDYDDEILDFSRVSAAVNRCEGVLQQRLDWLEPGELGRFDVIIGSEVLFNSRFFGPLLNVLERYLAPNGVVYLAHDVRRKSLSGFLKLCASSYDIAVNRRTLHSDDEAFEIIISRLVPKKK